MGDAADDLMFQGIKAEMNDEYFNAVHYEDMDHLYETQRLKWMSKEGQETLVQDMDDLHIKNIINFFRRKEPTSAISKWLEILNLEQLNRIP